MNRGSGGRHYATVLGRERNYWKNRKKKRTINKTKLMKGEAGDAVLRFYERREGRLEIKGE